MVDKLDKGGEKPNYYIEDYDTAQKKRTFLEVFVKVNGIVTAACQFVGIARQTYYNWRDSDTDFRERVNVVLRDQPEIVEDLLLKAIAREEPWAIAFYLKAKHPAYLARGKLQVYGDGVRSSDSNVIVFESFEKKDETSGEPTISAAVPTKQ